MHIRKARQADLSTCMAIYRHAQWYMMNNGNPDQWGFVHPPEEMIEDEIEHGDLYVCENLGEVVGCFYFKMEDDPTYHKIDGAWLNDRPYGVVHHIARAENAPGVGEFSLNWCYDQCHNLRIDTHEANQPMRYLLKRMGFTYTGIIWLRNGDERMAFQKTLD